MKRDKIVAPSDVWVIQPQPFTANNTAGPPLPSDKLITLTTCNPRWASTQRWAYWGIQLAATPASGPAPLGGQLMYGWIWRKLPGGRRRTGQIIGIMVVVIALLFLWVFPWITSHLPIDQVTV